MDQERMPDAKETIKEFLIDNKIVENDNISVVQLNVNTDFPTKFEFTAWLKNQVIDDKSIYPITCYMGDYDIATGEVNNISTVRNLF